MTVSPRYAHYCDAYDSGVCMPVHSSSDSEPPHTPVQTHDSVEDTSDDEPLPIKAPPFTAPPVGISPWEDDSLSLQQQQHRRKQQWLQKKMQKTTVESDTTSTNTHSQVANQSGAHAPDTSSSRNNSSASHTAFTTDNTADSTSHTTTANTATNSTNTDTDTSDSTNTANTTDTNNSTDTTPTPDSNLARFFLSHALEDGVDRVFVDHPIFKAGPVGGGDPSEGVFTYSYGLSAVDEQVRVCVCVSLRMCVRVYLCAFVFIVCM